MGRGSLQLLGHDGNFSVIHGSGPTGRAVIYEREGHARPKDGKGQAT